MTLICNNQVAINISSNLVLSFFSRKDYNKRNEDFVNSNGQLVDFLLNHYKNL